ncbi:hypothetical protein AB0M02_31080 [Actinoplanes sp. NPDC051861]|uniref:hypothetical protein n=1 Tax=Actinoplanes sp. NPDC051861 TaxID=3155170 RepID=UPI003437F4FB
MMTTVRDATYGDIRPVAGVLASCLLPTPLGRWLEPEPIVRGRRLFHHYVARLVEAIHHGAARLVEEHDEVIAAALWLPCPTAGAGSAATGGDGFAWRHRQLDDATRLPHLSQPHLRLARLGVLPRGRRRGIAAQLRTEREQFPGRCLATDTSVAALAARCGYRAYGRSPVLTFGGAAIVTMLHRSGALPASTHRWPLGPDLGSACTVGGFAVDDGDQDSL